MTLDLAPGCHSCHDQNCDVPGLPDTHKRFLVFLGNRYELFCLACYKVLMHTRLQQRWKGSLSEASTKFRDRYRYEPRLETLLQEWPEKKKTTKGNEDGNEDE